MVVHYIPDDSMQSATKKRRAVTNAPKKKRTTKTVYNKDDVDNKINKAIVRAMEHKRGSKLIENNLNFGVFNEDLLGANNTSNPGLLIPRGTKINERVGNQIKVTGCRFEVHIQDLRQGATQIESNRPRHHMLYLINKPSYAKVVNQFFKGRGEASEIAWGTEANARPNTLTTCPLNTDEFKVLWKKEYITYGDQTNMMPSQSVINDSVFVKLNQDVKFLLNADGLDNTNITPNLIIAMYSWDPTKDATANGNLTDNYFGCTYTYYWAE